MTRPLFIPLRSEYYEAFSNGSKTEELRLYGPRWNERACAVGRAVTLSKGYGKKKRMAGRIWKFKRQHGATFGSTYKEAILDCYGTLDVWIACISITVVRPDDESKRRAMVYVNSWAGLQGKPCRVVGETPKRYRIEVDEPTKLPGARMLVPGERRLVPKGSIRFVGS